MEVSPSRSVGSFEPFAWRMNVRRMPSAPPNSPASNTTLSRGDAWPDGDASVAIQSSWANTKAAKSTSWESSTSRSRVERPGLNVVVQGSTSTTSASPRVIAWSSFACLPDDPRKMRGLFMRDSPFRPRDDALVLFPDLRVTGVRSHKEERKQDDWWLALGHLFTGILLCLTIVGIPLGIASFKMAGAALVPFGR